MGKCKEFSINLAVLAPSNKRQFSFGMMRGCIDDNTPLYAMIFVLRDLINGEFQDRVKVGHARWRISGNLSLKGRSL